jgi:hypothetical protein
LPWVGTALPALLGEPSEVRFRFASDAGDPPVRFGGRGGRNQPAFPTPITERRYSNMKCASGLLDSAFPACASRRPGLDFRG